ncbi:alpha/beta fold hydrolase [Novacetimonas pomaceti]|uniref:Acyl-peptide hydrolase n=1 Tax=Novacetimonas pomaceti TaxID=2021998 RepID=A0A318QEA0_9PROT|nr:alpha/beta fold hydrolase [Novacetimonas pomaceti]PYD75672.1 peptidase S9 [Novacetimonas pomaceti]
MVPSFFAHGLLRRAGIGILGGTLLAVPAFAAPQAATQGNMPPGNTTQADTAQAGDAALEKRLSALLAMPFASEMTAASQAPRIAWVERREGARNIMLSDRGQAPRRMTDYTRDDGTDLWGLALTPDGRTLAYVEGGDPEFPNDAPPNAGRAVFAGKQTVHLILPSGRNLPMGEGHSPVFSPDGSHLAFSHGGTLMVGRTGTTPVAAFTTPGVITGLRWSPDNRRIAVEVDRGSHGVIALWDIDGRATDISFIPSGLASDVLPVFSPDGQSVAFVRKQEPVFNTDPDKGRFWSIHVHDIRTGTERVIWTPPQGKGSRFAAPEGGMLYWTADNQLLYPWEGSGWMRVCAMPATGEGAPKCLTPDGAEVSSYHLSSDGKNLLYTANAGNADLWRAWSQPLAGGAATPLTQEDEEVTELFTAGSDVAVMATSVTQTAHPVMFDHGTRQVPVTPALPPGISFVTPQNVRFHSADGLDLHGQLFVPPDDTSRRHPALVFVHGGPRRQMLPAFNAMGYYSNAYLMNQTLAAEGYVVLAVNYRSGSGYGEAFRNAPDTGEAGASEYRDVQAAATYLQHRDDVTPERIGIWGGSWGGYLTGLALARNSDIFAAGADFHGVHDMTGPDHPGLSPQQNREVHETEWRSSPIADIQHWRAPVLLVHGDDDHNVEFEQSTLLARMLTAQGIPYEDHVFPGERHAFLRTYDWLHAYLWMDHFFGRTLKQAQK